MRKIIVGAVATASIVGGAIGIAVVSPLGLAGAQDTPGTTVPGPAPSPDGPSTGGPNGKPGQPGQRGKGPGPLSETLKELVADGTITQAQADAITEKMKTKAGPGHGKGGRGGFGIGKDFAEVAAATIGIDVQTLMTEMKGGKSLADVARAHNVDPQKVIDALVAKGTADLDKAVAEGKITAEKAAEAKAKLVERTTGMVNGQFKGRPGGPGRHGPGHPGKDGAEPAPTEPAEPSTPAPPSTPGPPTTTSPAPTTPTTGAPTTTAPATTAPTTPAPATSAPAGPGTTAG